MNSGNDKVIVKDYFNATGFDRWQRIYGNGKVSKVQQDIRNGHQQTIDTVLGWLKDSGDLAGRSVCDAGCGVGSLSIPLAQAGARVYASDISEKMVTEAHQRAKNTLGQRDNPTFSVQDLEALSGRYHTVICLDVLIHYPEAQAVEMLAQLANLAESRLIVSFAPKTFWLSILKKIGEFFPGPSKTTRAYQHRETEIRAILERCGFAVERAGMVATRFYFTRILAASRP
ncbi:MAG: magnesium protoporphyrin IX methyltransferase [Chloroflexaceae bacterium]|nr:magnesium protoporphyrin IX methyltransferase [Chloroflexaceae bacterium]